MADFNIDVPSLPKPYTIDLTRQESKDEKKEEKPSNHWAQLLEDVEKLRQESPNVGVVNHEGQYIVRMSIDTGFLSKGPQKNISDKPVIVQLTFDPNYTMSHREPEIFVFQSSDADLNAPRLQEYVTDFGILQWFLETRAAAALRDKWHANPARLIEQHHLEQSLSQIEPNPQAMEQLMGMGFPEYHAVYALRRFNNDSDRALQFLLSGQVPDEEQKNETDSGSSSSSSTPAPPPVSEMEMSFRELVGMGFPQRDVWAVLVEQGPRTDRALACLLNNAIPKLLLGAPPMPSLEAINAALGAANATPSGSETAGGPSETAGRPSETQTGNEQSANEQKQAANPEQQPAANSDQKQDANAAAPQSTLPKNCSTWTADHVHEFLQLNGFDQYTSIFDSNMLHGPKLVEVNFDTLLRLGVARRDCHAIVGELQAYFPLPLPNDVTQWNADHLRQFLEPLGCQDYVVAFEAGGLLGNRMSSVNLDALQRLGIPRKDCHAIVGEIQLFMETHKPAAPPSKYDSQATNFVGMGFSKDDAIRALERYEGDVDKALQYLLDPTNPPALPVANTYYNNNNYYGGGYNGNAYYGGWTQPAVDQGSAILQLTNLGYDEDTARDALTTCEWDVNQAIDMLTATAASAASAAEEASKPKKESNALDCSWWTDGTFIVELYKYLRDRFVSSVSRCLICDANLDVNIVYKAPVCSNRECTRMYESSSCGGSIVDDIRDQPEAIDFMLNLLYAAATATQVKGWNRDGQGLPTDPIYGANRGYSGGNYQRGQHTFEPFPHNLGFDNFDGSQNLDLLLRTLDQIPPVERLKQFATDAELQIELDQVSKLTFPLLRWVIRSNRTYLALVPVEKQFRQMKTKLQFQVVSSFPEHERKFRDWLAQARGRSRVNRRGSYFAFHGSPVSNWHSIIRTGLRSGYVPGIYHAMTADTSVGYMGIGYGECQGWPNSMWECDNSISCLSMIEVADFRSEGRLVTGGVGAEVNVAMDHSLVITRYLFFYPRGIPGGSFGAVKAPHLRAQPSLLFDDQPSDAAPVPVVRKVSAYYDDYENDGEDINANNLYGY